MKKTIFFCLSAILVLASSCSGGIRKSPFEPFVIDNLEPKPDFWQVRPDEVMQICGNVKNGRVEVAARTPLGYPVYAVYFGDFSEAAPQTNWSAGNSSSSIKAYLGGAPTDRQTIMFVAGVHGSEPENVAAAVNMISLLDTGRDLRGREDPEFVSLASKYRFIIMPCVNMDGRSISPDHFHGQPYEVFRAASQGIWKDSTLVGWLGSKEYFPLPLDKVLFPGGYPNSEGYNIMHDTAPGDVRTEEAGAIMKIAARWRADFVLNGHSCEYQPFMIFPSNVETPAHHALAEEIFYEVNEAFLKEGLRSSPYNDNKPHDTMNLTNVIAWASGGLGMTMECSHSYDNIHDPKIFYTFDQLMQPAFTALKIIMRKGLERPLACRPE